MYSIKLGCGHMHCGENAVRTLADLPAQRKRAYIVMSGTIQQDLGQLKMVTDVLEGAGFTWKGYTDVEPEPSFQTVLRGAADMAALSRTGSSASAVAPPWTRPRPCGSYMRTPNTGSWKT